LFNKSRLLYGYHLAKESIYQNKKIIICEGYLDVVMFHQAGFKEAVAGMGTALTPEHLPLLRKGDPKVILAYDGDKAGIAAALKAAQMLSVAGFDGAVTLFPDGQDPADLIAKGKSDAVAKLLREAKPLIPFVIEMITSTYDLKDPRAKEAAFGHVKQYLDQLSQIIKDAYIPMAATLLGIAPTYFGGKTNPAKAKQSFTQKRDDVAQLSIIKTLLESPHLIDNVLDVIDMSMLQGYEALVASLLEGKTDHPDLIGLSLDEGVSVMSEAELNKALGQLMTVFYKNKLKMIPRDTTMSAEKKAFVLKKIKLDILPRLQKGELVALEDRI
jgi:DNA primase